jgi:hypothetical protein
MGELDELTAVACRRCWHGYPEHEDGGGHCRARVIGWGAVERDLTCMCPGMRWIDPAPPAALDYSAPPSPSWG